MSTQRSMTKSPVQLACEAYQVAQQGLESYSNRFSRRDFKQAQLFAVLVLRQFLKTDYRGIQQMLLDFSELRSVLELRKVPHFTTLQKAEQRLLKRGSLSACWQLFLNAHERAA